MGALLCLGSLSQASADSPPASTTTLQDSAWRSAPTPPLAAGSALFTRDLSPATNSAQATVTLSESAKGAKAGTRVTVNVACPAGQALRGGGASVQTSDGQNPGRALLSQSYASSTTTWTAVGVVGGDGLYTDEALDVAAIAVCA